MAHTSPVLGRSLSRDGRPNAEPAAGAPAVPPSGTVRCVSKWKQCRAVATGYGKRDCIFNQTLTATVIIS
jgi:hypothetical protein